MRLFHPGIGPAKRRCKFMDIPRPSQAKAMLRKRLLIGGSAALVLIAITVVPCPPEARRADGGSQPGLDRHGQTRTHDSGSARPRHADPPGYQLDPGAHLRPCRPDRLVSRRDGRTGQRHPRPQRSDGPAGGPGRGLAAQVRRSRFGEYEGAAAEQRAARRVRCRDRQSQLRAGEPCRPRSRRSSSRMDSTPTWT